MLWSAKTRVHPCWTWASWGLQAQLVGLLLWGNFSDPFQRWVNDKIYILVQISVEILLEQAMRWDLQKTPPLDHCCRNIFTCIQLSLTKMSALKTTKTAFGSPGHTAFFGGPIQVTHVSATCMCVPHTFGAVCYTELTVLMSADFLSQRSLESLRKTSAESIFTQNLLTSKPDSFLLKLFKHPEIFALP